MKKTIASAAFLAICASGATAGGIDRSGQGIGVIFEEGQVFTASLGYVMPTVSSTNPALAGDVGVNYSQLSFGYKQALNSNIDIALIYDQPFGADINYGAGPLVGTEAHLKSGAITAVGRYKMDSGISVHAGLRAQKMSGTVAVPLAGGYTLDADGKIAYGYLIGAAYERPDIALRVAITYNSAIKQTFDSTEFGAIVDTFEVTLPQSVNLDFQTGVAANTLVFGSVRWADWTSTVIAPPTYPANPLVDYDQDTYTYTLGVGRKFSDAFSGAVTLGYEKAQGGLASNLSPTDGFWSVSVGGSYTMGGTKFTGGVRYVDIGDATTKAGIPFSGNSAIGIGLSMTKSF